MYICKDKEVQRLVPTMKDLEIVGLFCKRDTEKRRYSAKETYDCKKTSLSLHIYIYRSLLQNIVSFLCLFCKRDLQSQDPSSYDCKKIIYVKIKKSKDQHIYRYAYVYMCISKINICIDMYMCIYVICKDKEVLVQS